jgi:hypothetical protein
LWLFGFRADRRLDDTLATVKELKEMLSSGSLPSQTRPRLVRVLQSQCDESRIRAVAVSAGILNAHSLPLAEVADQVITALFGSDVDRKLM